MENEEKIATEIMKTIKQLQLPCELDCITDVRGYIENSNHRAHQKFEKSDLNIRNFKIWKFENSELEHPEFETSEFENLEFENFKIWNLKIFKFGI